MKRNHVVHWLTAVVLLASAALCPPCRGQAVANAQISGTVTDSTGAAIPGAKLTATQTDTNVVRNTISSGDGTFVLPDLPIGPYSLKAEAKGFGTYVQTGINLQVGESPTINLALSVGQLTQNVEVSSDAAMVQTDSSSVSQVIDQARMVELPLNGRVPTQLVMLSGAANDIGPANGQSDLTGSKSYFSADSISVAGGQANGTNYLLDGGENMDTFSNVNLPLPFPDALQEFSVETSSLSARYGMHPGAVVNAVTKSGTNQFHGDLFEYVRNGDADAIDYFATQQDSLKRNQFGGTLGAPIIKNKVFGFFGYQETVIRTAPPSTYAYVPTQAALNGDFSELESAGCQSTGSARAIIDPTTGQPFQSDQVSPTRFNQQALAFLKYVPISTDPCGKITFALPEPQSEQEILGRVDSTLNSKNSVFGHIFLGNYSSPGPYSDSNILLTQLRGVTDHSLSGVAGDTYTINPNMVNSAHVGFTRLAVARGPSPNGIDWAKLGVNVPYEPESNYLYLSVVGHFTAGCGTCAAADLTQNNTQLAEDIDIQHGRNHISAGGEWVNYWSKITFDTLGAGEFSFNGQSTNDSLVDFMLGLPNSFLQGNIHEFDGRQNYFAAYGEDAVRLSKSLTAQIGVRWEPNLWGHEAANRMQHFDPNAFAAGTISTQFPYAPAGLEFPGDPGMPSGFSRNSPWKFEPRLGMSWDPTGKGRQVLRAGYGLFYDLLGVGYWEDVTGDAPWGNTITLTSPSGGFTNPYDGYPGGSPFPSPQPPSRNVTFPAQGTYYSYPTTSHQTYTNEWNLTYEVQPFNNWMFSAGYIGNTTIHVWSGEDKNAGVFIPGTCGSSPCSTEANVNQRRVLSLQNPSEGSYYSDIFEADDGGVSRYEGLLLKGEHRYNNNFTILGNYTYSHCISDADFIGDLGGAQTQNPNDLKGEHGNCGFDIRQGFNLSFVGDTPRLRNRLANQLVGTWRIAPILTMRSGVWFTPKTGTDNSLTTIGLDRPNVIGNPYVRNLKTLQWLTPAGYAPNPTGTFGDAGNDSLEGPKSIDLDAAISREFQIREGMLFNLRFEAFNALNHPNFSNPDNILADSTFGAIQSDAGPRILQFAGRFQF